MTAEELLAGADALLLDFDGPICSVFAGIPAASVADQLRAILADHRHVALPEAVDNSEDPFDVLRYAAILGEDEGRYIEAAFAAHEVEAITSASPTPGAHQLMTTWHRSGRALAIVSNNGVAAINVYLDLHRLRPFVDYVSARTSFDVGRLKPDPHLLRMAAEALVIAPERSVFIGDSLTDIQAAHVFGIPVMAYANKSDKLAPFTAARPAKIISALPSRVR